MKKIMAVLLCASLMSGCGLMNKVCANKDEAYRVKSEAGILLATVQIGYEQAVAIARSSPDPKVAIAIGAIDLALATLGHIIYDYACPAYNDLVKARYAAQVAKEAQATLQKAKVTP